MSAQGDALIPFPWDNRLNLYADPDRMLRFAVLVDAILLLQPERAARDVKRKRRLEEAKRHLQLFQELRKKKRAENAGRHRGLAVEGIK